MLRLEGYHTFTRSKLNRQPVVAVGAAAGAAGSNTHQRMAANMAQKCVSISGLVVYKSCTFEVKELLDSLLPVAMKPALLFSLIHMHSILLGSVVHAFLIIAVPDSHVTSVVTVCQ
jgi:hypothetical protein